MTSDRACLHDAQQSTLQSKKVPSRRDEGGPNTPQTLTLTLHLKEPRKLRRRLGSAAEIAELSERLSREQLRKDRQSELRAPIAEIRSFAKRNNMAISEIDVGRRRVKIEADRAVALRAFGTRLEQVEHGGRHYHCPARAPRVPKALEESVQAVLGFDARPRVGRLRAMTGPGGSNGLYPADIGRLYGMAAPGRGAGQCLALIEPSGGYNRGDLAAACRAMQLPLPTVIDVEVGGGRNAFGSEPRADMEVSLDVQVAASMAPEARLVVYFTENTETGLADGLAEAVHDTTNRPGVIVITWGEPESIWPDGARAALDAALADAVRLGVTVVAAAGDDLATERVGDGKAHVDYPASSPYVLGCGGTRIDLDATGTAILDEVVWNDGLRGTGGGISDLYPLPAYQKALVVVASVNDGRVGRGVPDVAAAASQINGYRIILNGSEIVTGGTSAVAPLWGAFITLLNEQRGRTVGFVNPLLYRQPALLRPVKRGDNAMFGIGYEAGLGWSACTGLGSPIGPDIVKFFTNVA